MDGLLELVAEGIFDGCDDKDGNCDPSGEDRVDVGDVGTKLCFNVGEYVDIRTGVRLGSRVLGADVDGINVGDTDGDDDFRSIEGALVIGFAEGRSVGYHGGGIRRREH